MPIFTGTCAHGYTCDPLLRRYRGGDYGCTWDCNGLDGAPMGGLIVAERTHACFGLNGLVACFGKLYLLDPENIHLPHFVVLNGDLKAVVGAQALSLTGPPDHPEIIHGKLFLMIVFNETDQSYCRRRVEPAG